LKPLPNVFDDIEVLEDATLALSIQVKIIDNADWHSVCYRQERVHARLCSLGSRPPVRHRQALFALASPYPV